MDATIGWYFSFAHVLTKPVCPPNQLPCLGCNCSVINLPATEVPQMRQPLQVDGHLITMCDWTDLWHDANMDDVIQYLRSSKYCIVPEDVNKYIPWEIL